jgi:hypothetical protein
MCIFGLPDSKCYPILIVLWILAAISVITTIICWHHHILPGNNHSYTIWALFSGASTFILSFIGILICIFYGLYCNEKSRQQKQLSEFSDEVQKLMSENDSSDEAPV